VKDGFPWLGLLPRVCNFASRRGDGTVDHIGRDAVALWRGDWAGEETQRGSRQRCSAGFKPEVRAAVVVSLPVYLSVLVRGSLALPRTWGPGNSRERS